MPLPSLDRPPGEPGRPPEPVDLVVDIVSPQNGQAFTGSGSVTIEVTGSVDFQEFAQRRVYVKAGNGTRQPANVTATGFSASVVVGAAELGSATGKGTVLILVE